MTWFKVDDKLHANTKIRKLLADDPAALALWTVAGSWVADELNDGFVPDDQLPWLMPARADELAQKLVNKRLWRRVRGGYEFHEWHADGDGTRRNPTREEVLAERQRKAEAGRKGGLASGKARSKPEARASADASAPAKQVLADSLNPRPVPSRPSPSNEGERASTEPGHPPSGEPPPPRCPEHINDPDPPNCGACGRARKTSEAWETAEAERQRQITALAKSEAARQRAETQRIAIDRCRTCDDRGYLPSGRACNHQPEATPGAATAARDIARAAAGGRRDRHSMPGTLDQALAEVIPIRPAEEPA